MTQLTASTITRVLVRDDGWHTPDDRTVQVDEISLINANIQPALGECLRWKENGTLVVVPLSAVSAIEQKVSSL